MLGKPDVTSGLVEVCRPLQTFADLFGGGFGVGICDVTSQMVKFVMLTNLGRAGNANRGRDRGKPGKTGEETFVEEVVG